MTEQMELVAPGRLSMTLSLSRKITTGKFENAEVFVSVSGVTIDTTEAEINALLDSRVAWDAVKAHLAEKVREVRGDAFEEFNLPPWEADK